MRVKCILTDIKFRLSTCTKFKSLGSREDYKSQHAQLQRCAPSTAAAASGRGTDPEVSSFIMYHSLRMCTLCRYPPQPPPPPAQLYGFSLGLYRWGQLLRSSDLVRPKWQRHGGI